MLLPEILPEPFYVHIFFSFHYNFHIFIRDMRDSAFKVDEHLFFYIQNYVQLIQIFIDKNNIRQYLCQFAKKIGFNKLINSSGVV